MYDIQTQILSVTGRPTRTGRSMWDVQVADQSTNGGKFSTFDPNAAAKANSMVGRNATVRIEQKGQYWNFVDAFAQGEQAPIVPGIVQGAPQVNGGGNGGSFGPPPAIEQNTGGRGGEDPAKALRISRQNANTAAAHLIGSVFHGAGPEALPEAVKAFQRLAREMTGFGQQGVFADIGGGAQQATPVPQTPQQVADVVNAELPDAVVVGAQPTEQQQQAGDVEWT